MFSAIPDWIQGIVSSPEWDYFPKIAVALILGALIGLERRSRHKIAGLRTHMVLSVSGCLAAVIGLYVAPQYELGDPTRIAAQLLASLGFVGAGVILKRGKTTQGVTTAATLCFAAVVGIAVGMGLFVAATFSTLLILSALFISYRFLPSHELGGHTLTVKCKLDQFNEVIKLLGNKCKLDTLEKSTVNDIEYVEFRVHTELHKDAVRELLLTNIHNDAILAIDMDNDDE